MNTQKQSSRNVQKSSQGNRLNRAETETRGNRVGGGGIVRKPTRTQVSKSDELTDDAEMVITSSQR